MKRPEDGLMLVAGAGGGGGKGGGGSARSPVEAPDSLRSIQYVSVLHALCEGETEGWATADPLQSIYFDGTPIKNADGSYNFSGASIQWTEGTPDQQPLGGFGESQSETAVGVVVTADTPVVRTIINPNVDAIRLTIGVPQLSQTDTKTGDVNGTSVQLAIDVQRNGGGYQTLITDTIDGKTTSRYQRSYRIAISSRYGSPGGTFDVRVRRITADSTSSWLVNAFSWESYTEIVEDRLMYPYTALVGVRVDASQFQSLPSVGFDKKLIRVRIPSNYNPATRAYTGAWDGTFTMGWTDNPAWIYNDIATNPRYGLGQYIAGSQVDKWGLYAIAQYCDQLVPNGLGGTEPRYTCNVYIQSREEAISVLGHFAGIFNGLNYWAGGMLTPSADMPGDIEAQFTRGNVVDGRFEYVGTPLNQRHTVALVTWNDPAQRYAQTIEYVEDAEAIAAFGIREAQVTAFGCTSRGQAHRLGRWLLLTEKYLAETVQFRVGLEMAGLRPGSLITTSDPVRIGQRWGGRLLDSTTTTLNLDAPVTIEAGRTYTATVQMPDGTLQTRTATAPVGEQATLTLSSALPAAPSRMAVWVLTSDAVAQETWRIINIAEEEGGALAITAGAWRADKFAAIENDLTLAPLQTTTVSPFSQGAPTELVALESLYSISPVLVGSRVTLSWLSKGGARFDVVAQRESDTPVRFTDLPLPTVDIQPTRPGMWTFSIVATNALGAKSAPATLTQELLGLTAPPANVGNFSLDILGDNANLSWNPATDLDVLVGGAVVVKFAPATSGAAWEDGAPIKEFPGGAGSGIVPLMVGTYLAKFRDGSGNYSSNAALIVSTTGPLRDYNLIETLAQQPAWAGTKTSLTVNTTTGTMSMAATGDLLDSLTAVYEFPGYVDLGGKYTCRVGSLIDGVQYDIAGNVDAWPDVDAVANVDGTQVDGGGCQLFAAFTDDDPASTPTWTDWRQFTAADFAFRGIKFKAVLTSPAANLGITLSRLEATVDVPDRLESGNNLAVATSGTHVTFAHEFIATPAISIIAQGLATGDYWQVTNQTSAGFDIAFFNASGAHITRTCDWIARGYGYKH